MLEAYRRAADLKPENAASLWYLLYNQHTKSGYGNELKDLDIAQGYLERAAARDRANAWPLYEEAGILFRRVPFSLTGPSENRDVTPEEKKAHRDAVRTQLARKQGRRAIDRIVQGNTTPDYRIPIYFATPPEWLLTAWRYDFPMDMLVNDPFIGSARIRELARACVGYANFTLENYNDRSEATRAAEAIVGMGRKMIGDWSLKPDYVAGKAVIQVLNGMTITTMGYKNLITLYDTTGDSSAKESAQAESDAFQAQCMKYRAALKEYMKADSYMNSYIRKMY